MGVVDKLSGAHLDQLLAVARHAISHGISSGTRWTPGLDGFEEALLSNRAVFVTLRTATGDLRGCVGNLVARAPLVVETARAAHNAALQDPRFAALALEELAALSVSISVLGPPSEMQFDGESDLLTQLRPGIDGLILHDVGRSSTFLPSVWESLPEPKAFLGALKAKAGLPREHWSEALRIERYTTESFGEQ